MAYPIWSPDSSRAQCWGATSGHRPDPAAACADLSLRWQGWLVSAAARRNQPCCSDVCAHAELEKKKLTVKLSPADFPVSCSGNSLLYSGQILSFSQKNEIKLIGILIAAKWILAQTLLTKIFQALAVLHLDLWSISGNASIMNELVLISPPRLMFWQVLRWYRCPFPHFSRVPSIPIPFHRRQHLLQAQNTQTCTPKRQEQIWQPFAL